MLWQSVKGLLVTGAVTAGTGAYRWWWAINRYPEISDDTWERGFNPAPSWLSPALRALPSRELSDAERERFRTDGAILVRRILPDRRILRLLRSNVPHEKAAVGWTLSFLRNGILNALVRDGPLGQLAASALNVSDVAVWNAQVEPRPPRSLRRTPYPEKPWYDERYGDPLDHSVHEDTDAYRGALHKGGHFVKPLASLFLAVTDLPHGLELLAGSHVANQRHRCLRTFEASITGEFQRCMDRLERDCTGVRWWDLAPGDAILFYGSVLHWTVHQNSTRVALSVRYIPADLTFTGVFPSSPQSYYPWKCGPIGDSPVHPLVYSRRNRTMRSHPWPVWHRFSDDDENARNLRQFAMRLDPRCGPIVDW